MRAYATRSVRCAILALSVGFAISCTSAPAPPSSEEYAEEVARLRADKDRLFRESAESPIPPERREGMLPLPYFPIDEDARVPAVLHPSTDDVSMEMPTSTGKQRQMRRVGTLQFTYKGQRQKLTAFHEVGAPPDRLFVPFADLTTGTETYAAGRYLELDPTPTGIYNVDFNRAYHPFCYFDARYDCPYPPPENRLKVAVRAGERLPESR